MYFGKVRNWWQNPEYVFFILSERTTLSTFFVIPVPDRKRSWNSWCRENPDVKTKSWRMFVWNSYMTANVVTVVLSSTFGLVLPLFCRWNHIWICKKKQTVPSQNKIDVSKIKWQKGDNQLFTMAITRHAPGPFYSEPPLLADFLAGQKLTFAHLPGYFTAWHGLSQIIY